MSLREGHHTGYGIKGTVRNVIDFGCFVDIGVHQDGLVHISEICDRYIKHPLEAVSVGDIVDVQVMSVDLKKQRIQLTMKIGQGTDKAGKSEHSGSGKDSVANKADRSNRNNGGRNSRNDRNSTGSKNNNNRNKKPHYIKARKIISLTILFLIIKNTLTKHFKVHIIGL